MDTGLNDHREQARHIHGKLTDELQSVTLLEEELKRQPTSTVTDDYALTGYRSRSATYSSL